MEKFHVNVQSKIPCIYHLNISSDQKSSKKSEQNFNIEASNQLIPDVYEILTNEICLVTEKIDGTCSLIQLYDGKPWLWLRHDRKPINSKNKKSIVLNKSWNFVTDYNEAPFNWQASKSCILPNNKFIADPINGHLMGWVPFDQESRQHCWHASVLNEDFTKALILTYDSYKFTLSYLPLAELLDTTLELIGTNINANPYKLGSKKFPLHFLIIHGSIPIDEKVKVYISNTDSMKSFFYSTEGQVEGIVWHTHSGLMYKLHRHHIKLEWPIEKPRICTIPVIVQVDDINSNSLKIKALIKLSGHYDNLYDLSEKFIKFMEKS